MSIIIREVVSDEELNKVFKLRYDIYAVEFGFENKDKFTDCMEQDIYDDFSIHFAVFDGDKIVGTARIILDNMFGFPTYDKIELYDNIKKPENHLVVEISRLAIDKKYRKRVDVLIPFYKVIYRKCKELNITHLLMITEKHVVNGLLSLGCMFKQIGDPINDHGIITPYIVSIEDCDKNIKIKI